MRKSLLSIVLCLSLMLSSITMIFGAGLEGTGTEQSPYLIKAYNDLWLIPKDSTSYYKITNDLDGTGTSKLSLPNFKGTLDGDGHTIKNVTILDSSFYVGLFSYTEGAKIKNLTMDNINIQGFHDTSFVGGLIGLAKDSSITDVKINGGSVRGTRSGGLLATISNSSIVSSSVNATIVGSYSSGGLVNTLYSDTVDNIISKSSSAGSITGPYAGGLVGVGSTRGIKIDNCFSNANVSATAGIGGLLGISGEAESITNSYFAGTLTGATKNPLSYSTKTIYVSSYFDSDILKITTPSNQAMTTANMKKQSTYSDWDFENIWEIKEGIGYPTLRGMGSTPTPPIPVTITSIDLPLAQTLKAGKTYQQTPTIVTDVANANADLNLSWTISDETIAKVSATGNVSALSPGQTTLRVTTSNNLYADCVITVVGDSPLPVPVTFITNDNSTDIEYNGAWAYYSDPIFYQGDEHYSKGVGDYVQYTFRGQSINWIGATSINLGIADIYIDGTLLESVDLYSPTLEAQKVLFSKTNLTDETHTIKIVVTGLKNPNATDSHVTIDSFKS